MPLVDIHLIEGESLRGVTWVRVKEVASGDWGIGGKALTASDAKALQNAWFSFSEPGRSRAPVTGTRLPCLQIRLGTRNRSIPPRRTSIA